MGDFNAHHLSLSTSANRISNQRGLKLAESFDKNCLVLLNYSHPTGINLSTNAIYRWSLLDLTLASRDIASKCETHVTDTLLGSDHFIIITTVNSKVTRSSPMPRKWSFDKANWKKFSVLVDTHLENNIHSIDETDTEALNLKITSSIITAAQNTIPKSKFVGKKPVPWWNHDYDRVVRRKKICFS